MKKIIILLLFITSCTSINPIIRHTHKKNNTKVEKVELIDYEPYIKVKLSTRNSNDNYRGEIYYSNKNRINELLLEEYLYSVVSSEVPSSFSYEAIKAQAVAARTYAYYQMLYSKNNGFDVYDSVRSQAYNGKKSEKDIIKKAVRETKGIIIFYDDKPIEALYHSSSGFKTTAAKDYYNNDISYLQSVEDYALDKTWDYSISKKKFEDIFSITLDEVVDMDKVIYFNDKVKTKKEIREKLALKSANFSISFNDDKVYFDGIGYGHGVGMSQFGADYLAKQGFNFIDILKHYYVGVSIKKIY